MRWHLGVQVGLWACTSIRGPMCGATPKAQQSCPSYRTVRPPSAPSGALCLCQLWAVRVGALGSVSTPAGDPILSGTRMPVTRACLCIHIFSLVAGLPCNCVDRPASHLDFPAAAWAALACLSNGCWDGPTSHLEVAGLSCADINTGLHMRGRRSSTPSPLPPFPTCTTSSTPKCGAWYR